MQNQESVLVCPAELVRPIGQGWISREWLGDHLDRILYGGNLSYIERERAENDQTFKQIIPYILLTDGEKFFSYVRGKKGGEGRLHDFRSVGIGGHINPVDGEPNDDQTYIRGFERELLEEIGHTHSGHATLLGVVNDDSNPVGQVHLGVVHRLLVLPQEVKFTDPALLQGEFVDFAFLQAHFAQYESWSRIVLAGHLGMHANE